MSNLGQSVVEAINNFEKNNKRLPASLHELEKNYIENIFKIDSGITWQYDVTDHIKRNKNSINHPNYKPMEKDVFNLWLRKSFLGLERLKYNRESQKFELYDDI